MAGELVLVVDDEVALADVVRAYLERAGLRVATATDGLVALDLARAQDPAVVILDLGLPGLDGLEVCRRLRETSDCYVIMLTARSDEVDRVVGLTMGADDYVTKPFSPRELVARVQAVLRRPRVGQPVAEQRETRRVGAMVVDVDAREVAVDGQPVELTPTEFDLLQVLTSRLRFAWSRRQLMDQVWGEGTTNDDHLVDVHVAHLRQKLGGSAKHVETVRGVGYRVQP